MHADGIAVGGRGHPAVFGFYANKQLTTGEGGMVTLGDEALKERIDSERNQGRAPDMGWLDHDRLGFNYRLSDIACALGLAQLERLDGMLAARGAGRRALPRGAGRDRGARAALRGSRRRRARLVRVRRPAAARASIATRRSARLRRAGIQSKPYLPAIHLMSFYRERFGHRAGRVPGLRGRRRALAGAAVLPGDDRGPGRACRPGAARDTLTGLDEGPDLKPGDTRLRRESPFGQPAWGTPAPL